MAVSFLSDNVSTFSSNATTSSLAWKDYMSSFIGFSGDFHLKSSAVWYNGFAELNNSITFSPVYQNHPEISDKYYPTDEQGNNAACEHCDYYIILHCLTHNV